MDNINFFQCHKHLLLKSYRLGKPWKPLHYPPSSSQSDGHLSFEFCWQTLNQYFNLLDQTPITPHLIKTTQERDGVVSIPVNRLEFFKNDTYARCLFVDSLIPNTNSPAGDFEADWLVSRARNFLQTNPNCQTMLIGLQVFRCHLCFESRLVRNVMERSFEEINVVKPASKWSLELLKSVDFEHVAAIDLPNCVVCQEELFLCREKEVVDLPCSHMFHGECILRWLQNSHYCPICRFKMPTT